MPRKYLRNRFVLFATICLLASGLTDVARAQPLPGYVLSGPMLPLLVQMPENGWLSVNANFFSDVWTPPELEPLVGAGAPPQSRIIYAWSGYAWDRNRGDLILYGGGHANYSGNDVYRWRSSTLRWERASLPSEIWYDPVSGYQAIDGVNAAPSAAHTYVNNLFLPIADRFLTWGGSAYDNGGPYLRVSETDPTQTRYVGPYLFDPNRADGNKVGGTTGSHVMRESPHPEIVGGRMWENRDISLHLAGQDQPVRHTNGCAAYVAEGGHDVVYVAGTSASITDLDLYRYQLTSLANPALDQIDRVGAFWVGNADQTTCGYDPVRKLFVRTGTNAFPFSFWDLTTPGPNNLDQWVQVDATIAGMQSWMASKSIDMLGCALEFDPVRQTFSFWCGADTIWELHPPPAGNTASGWTVTQRPPSSTSAPTADPTGTSILGKWHYAPYYDVFIWLEDINEGNIWVYKPVGWLQPNPPGNALPTATITSPANGSNVAPGTPLNLTAIASDSDGTIARVEFYVNGTKVGQVTSPPYIVGLTPIFVGTYTVVAVAVDNVGGMKASVPVGITVSAQLTTATLQRGLNTYAGVTDTFLDAYDPDTPYGASSQLLLDAANYTPLVRFAIFQSEGGPVPNRAVIQSAKLELYKQFYDDPLRLNALLKPWLEGQASWTESQMGTAWSASGAAGAGTDYDVAADALVSGDWNPGWIAFDVTPRVQQWSNALVANYGWRLAQVGTNGNFKEFFSSEYSSNSTLRPKLTIVYAGASKVATSVALTSSANPSVVGASVTFSATVQGSAPTGGVNFTDGAAPIPGCSAVAVTGVGNTRTAQCTTSGLSVATHSIIAVYGGDAGNTGSTGTPLLQTVNSKFASSVTLVSSANPSIVGASVTFTATVHGSAPTGSVNFTDGAAPITGCSAVAVTGVGDTRTAQCTTSSLNAATHSIIALYGGDIGNNGSTSATLLQIVNQVGPPPTMTTLVSTPNPSALGGKVIFTATVTGSLPTGSVAFADSGINITGCGAAVLNGLGNVRTAACVTSSLSGGAHSVVATYSGNAANAGSSSTPLSQIVNAITGTNFALASNGGVASASSTYTVTGQSFTAAAVNNGERAGLNWGNGGAWKDDTADVFPDWVQINFDGPKRIAHVVVYSLQDNYSTPIEPTDTMTFSIYGITDFTVQGWDGSSWITLGTVAGNSLVKRTVNVTEFTTDRVRINITQALASYSRITEIEAWGDSAANTNLPKGSGAR